MLLCALLDGRCKISSGVHPLTDSLLLILDDHVAIVKLRSIPSPALKI